MAQNNLTRESQESILDVQLNQRYTYEYHKIFELVPKITQDEVAYDLNLNTELNGTVEVQKTQVEKASIVIKGNIIYMTSSNQVDDKNIIKKISDRDDLLRS